jgi:two-component system, NtrC family, sensor kinase
VRLPETGESAAKMPWLWPDAHSLAVLAQPLSPETWSILSRDPAALLLCHRNGHCLASPSQPIAIEPARLLQPRILELALQWFLHDRGNWLDWRHPLVLPVYRTALAIAHNARLIAEMTSACDANAAWTAGLLSPLGWLAVAATNPFSLADIITDESFADQPVETQQRHWGLDHASIARRLARRWQLPDWLRITIGHLELPIDAAASLGVDAALFATIQLAVGMAEHAGFSLGLLPVLDPETLLKRLNLRVADLRLIEERFQETELAETFETEWGDPRSDTRLPEFIREVIEDRRTDSAPFLAPLEHDLDRLHTTLIHWKQAEEQRVRNAKLAALVEFAAGASHEINNPLAVISGQSQYLLHREIEDDLRPSLESIVRQTQRIHAILTELMQFARPPQLTRKRIVLRDAVYAAVEMFRATASGTGIRLECANIPLTLWVDADLRHLQTAIGCLVRNAIEAAARNPRVECEEYDESSPPVPVEDSCKGWVRLRLERSGSTVDLIVEDSGLGPTAAQCEHLFDPFYSGRTAGRGRGLGLPTAWRLAREHGGDVYYVPAANGPTRFVLTLPLPNTAVLERLSA